MVSRFAAAAAVAGAAVHAAASSCAHKFAEASYPSFTDFCAQHGLHYTGAELSQREATYDAAVKSMKAHNANPSKTWTMGVNELTALTDAEQGALYGMAFSGSSGGGQAPSRKRGGAGAAEVLPDSWDWREKRPSVVSPVKHQGSCGSCWAFAATAVLESHIAIQTGTLFSLSPQQIVSCAPNPNECGGSGGCSGSTVQLAFNYTKYAGILSEWTYSYTSGVSKENGECFPLEGRRVPVANIGGFANVPKNLAPPLQQALVEHGPVGISVAAGKWRHYSGGIFPHKDCDYIINHAVTLMGFGAHCEDKYWLIRNSWGPTWGEKGYIRLERAATPTGEQCGWDTEPMSGSACKKPLDGSNPPEKIWVCGTCGMLADSTYPTGGSLGAPTPPDDPALATTASPAMAQARAHSFAGGLPEGADGAAFIQSSVHPRAPGAGPEL